MKMTYFERRKSKTKLTWFAMSPKTLIISIFSFTLGFIFNALLHNNLNLDEEDIYFGDSPNYELKSGTRDVFLVVLVLSSISNFNRREAIRNTWLLNVGDDKEIVYFFAVSSGSASESQKKFLKTEQEKYKDLLIFDNLDDSFYLLTSKILASFGWLTDFWILGDEGKSSTPKTFRKFKYLLKCDDDSFVRVSDVVGELKTVFTGEKGKNLYWGFFDGHARPKKAGKYKEDEWIICDYYIPYALGGGYVLAYPLVHFIARNGDFLVKYKSEDISLGAWLSVYKDLNRVHEPRFDTEYISRGCHQSYLITHKHSEVAMQNFHKSLLNNGRLCQKEFRTRMSYIYNWSVPPSKCCARYNPDVP